jgi:hypothetical protein
MTSPHDIPTCTTVHSVGVDGHAVDIVKIDPRRRPPNRTFSGQKIMHPFSTEREETAKGADSKPWLSNVHYSGFASSDVKMVIQEDSTVFEIKHDGSCGALVWDSGTQSYKPHARFDVKKDKTTGLFAHEKIKPTWIPCETEPTDEKATHWPHFRPLAEDPRGYKWYLEAFNNSFDFVSGMSQDVFGDLVTVEFMGPKFNGKECDPIENKPHGVGIVIHGSLRVIIPPPLRTFDGFRRLFEELPILEGLVAYPTDGTPMKIRAETFKGLTWGKKGTPVPDHLNGVHLSQSVVL